MQRNVSGRELYLWLETNCLFVLLTRSRCCQGTWRERGRRVLLHSGAEDLLASINPTFIKSVEQNAVVRKQL